MSEYQEISEQIRAYLAANGQTLNDGLADLASHYANLCREANSRLRRCDDYLRKGMRSEAIHLADCQPDLFQLVEGLQVPERQEWAQICATHGLPIPPQLFAGPLDELKEAFAAEQELMPLLSRHRVLALAHAKLAARLDVLRLLADADPDNACWIGEIRSLENARLHEMQIEAKIALRQKDTNALRRLSDELSSHAWLCDIPEDLTRLLAKHEDSNGHEQDLSEMRLLASRLSADYQGKTERDQTRSDIKRWEELTRAARPDLPSDLLSQVSPALAWLAEKKSPVAQPSPRMPPNPALRRTRIERIMLAIMGLVFACAAGMGWFLYYRASHPK